MVRNISLWGIEAQPCLKLSLPKWWGSTGQSWCIVDAAAVSRFTAAWRLSCCISNVPASHAYLYIFTTSEMRCIGAAWSAHGYIYIFSLQHKYWLSDGKYHPINSELVKRCLFSVVISTTIQHIKCSYIYLHCKKFS